MENYKRFKNQDNNFYRLQKYLRISTLFVLAIFFAFPNITSSKNLKDNSDSLMPIARETISSYYDGPTLPEIPRREPRRTMRVVVTSYNSEPGQTDDTPFITASGSRTRDGVVAANFLPFGTIVRFPEVFGDKEFVVEDRMNKRYYYRADIWMENKQDSIDFGAQYLEIEIL